MDSPEYHKLVKELTRASLSGLIMPGAAIDRRSSKKGLEAQTQDIKRIVERNDLSPEICDELCEELKNPDKQDAISQPLRDCYRRLQDEDIKEIMESVKVSDSVLEEMIAAIQNGENLLVRGMDTEEKLDIGRAAACHYYIRSQKYHKLKMLAVKCTKHTSGLEVSFDRRRYLDGRIQLGYVAQGMLLAHEHPKRLYVLILDEVDVMDALVAFDGCGELLKRKDLEKLIARNTIIKNCQNFVLIVTRNMENDTPNRSMDNLGLKVLFHAMDCYDANIIRKRKSRKMI